MSTGMIGMSNEAAVEEIPNGLAGFFGIDVIDQETKGELRE
jgi:hypothetical protein